MFHTQREIIERSQTHNFEENFIIIHCILKSEYMRPLYKLQNCTFLFLFGLHNQILKRNQKSKKKRNLHEKKT